MATVNQEIHLVRYMVMHRYVDVDKTLIKTLSMCCSDHVSALCLVAHWWGIALNCIGEVLIVEVTD